MKDRIIEVQLKILNKIKCFLRDNRKIDVYRCEIILSKNHDDKITMRRTFLIAKGFYPSRRKIAKTFEDEIKKHIFNCNLYNSIVVVHIICKIGTFKYKVINNGI